MPVLALAEELLEEQVDRFAGKEVDIEDQDIPALIREISRVFGVDTQTLEGLELEEKGPDEITDTAGDTARRNGTEKSADPWCGTLKISAVRSRWPFS